MILVSDFNVCFDDLDAGGVVYHPYYLIYCDRARNELLSRCGFGVVEGLRADTAFAVTAMHTSYNRSLTMGPWRLWTRLTEAASRSLVFRHEIYPPAADHRELERMTDPAQRHDSHFSATCKVICISLARGAARRIDPELLFRLQAVTPSK